MTVITREEAQQRLADVLKTVGIKAVIGGCSCCGTFDIEFPNGDTCSDDSFYFECDGISHRRG